MNKTMIATVLSAALALPGFVFAQTASTPRVDQRQESQQKRIDQGVKSGELTKKEARRLDKGQNRVEKIENKAMADGTVTNREKTRIEKAQDRQSKRIYRQKHDRQTAK